MGCYSFLMSGLRPLIMTTWRITYIKQVLNWSRTAIEGISIMGITYIKQQLHWSRTAIERSTGSIEPVSNSSCTGLEQLLKGQRDQLNLYQTGIQLIPNSYWRYIHYGNNLYQTGIEFIPSTFLYCIKQVLNLYQAPFYIVSNSSLIHLRDRWTQFGDQFNGW